MLRNTHQLNVGISHLLHISSKLYCKLSVIIKSVLGTIVFLTPGTRMHLVDRDRLLTAAVSRLLAAAGHPLAVCPAEAPQIRNNRCIIRTHLCTICIRIRLHKYLIIPGKDLIFVYRPWLHPRDKQLINTGYLQRTHRMQSAIPHIKVTDHTDGSRMRRPDCKICTLNTIDLHRVSTQLIKDLVVLALCKQIKIQAGKLWCKAIRICSHYHVILTVLDIQKIWCLKLLAVLDIFPKKSAARLHLFQLGRMVSAHICHGNCFRLRTIHGKYLSLAKIVKSQYIVRGIMSASNSSYSTQLIH